ncbi:MAG: arylsulfatase [Phycisphaerales bacterium]|nr:arylsulfatase [Phycisphaerales bacterium]
MMLSKSKNAVRQLHTVTSSRLCRTGLGAIRWAACVAAALGVGRVSADAAAATATPSAKPDIVYILADDMGYGDVSILNAGDRIQTPHIDSIGRDGMIFTNAHGASALCTPSRYGLLTGRDPWRSAMKAGEAWGVAPPLIEKGRMTIASLLKDNGYHTGFVGKWNLGLGWQYKPGEPALIKGKPDFFNSSTPEPYRYSFGYSMVNASRVDYTKPILDGPLTNGFDFDFYFAGSADMYPFVYIKNDRPVGPVDRTYTISKAMMGAHFSRTGPAGAYFNPVHVLPDFNRQACNFIVRHAHDSHPFFLYYAMPAPHTPIAVAPAYKGKSPLPFAYLDYCIETDAMVGKVLATLKKEGLADKTIVVFTSDNGFAPYVDPTHYLERHGDYPSYIFRGFKSDIWEGGQRVPFLIDWPGITKPGSTNQSPICLTDFMATMATYLHYTLPPDAGEDSFNIMPALKGGNISYPVITASIDGSLAIIDGSWKLEMCPGSGGWTLPNRMAKKAHLPAVQLYNMDSWLGITEQFNVAKQYPKVVHTLEALLARDIRNGRSTPGPMQHNDNPQMWPAITWTKSLPAQETGGK